LQERNVTRFHDGWLRASDLRLRTSNLRSSDSGCRHQTSIPGAGVRGL